MVKFNRSILLCFFLISYKISELLLIEPKNISKFLWLVWEFVKMTYDSKIID